MYLNHNEIQEIIKQGQMKYTSDDCINAASLDVRLGNTLLVERFNDAGRAVDYRARQKLDMKAINLSEGGYVIRPGEFVLAHTMEHCDFADDLAALFRIKSSMGRIGLEHMDAGWVDPGFNGALTLEFKNMTQWHEILIRPGDKIGQLIFMRGNPVSSEQSYRERGNYNGSDSVVQVQYKT
jgi:dCTP deaminase